MPMFSLNFDTYGRNPNRHTFALLAGLVCAAVWIGAAINYYAAVQVHQKALSDKTDVIARRLVQAPIAEPAKIAEYLKDQVALADIDALRYTAGANTRIEAGGAKAASASGLLATLASILPPDLTTVRASSSVRSATGVVTTLTSSYQPPALAASLFNGVLFAVIGSVAISLLLFLISRSVRRLSAARSAALEKVSEQITRTGDLSARMPSPAPNSSGQLEATVNRLLDQLDQQEKRRSRYRAHLESEVDRRTKALAESNERLQRLAYTSTEASLPNRTAFLDKLHKSVGTTFDDGTVLALFVLRIMSIRHANERFGLDVGDLMIEFAGRGLAHFQSATSDVFHIGGGEFAIIRRMQPLAIEPFASEVVAIGDSPFVCQGATLNLDLRLGVASLPLDAKTVDDLTRFSMLALNAAASQGRNNVVALFQPRMQTESVAAIQMAAAMQRAVDREEFEPYFQPRVETRTGKVHGLEAFIRWTSEELAGFSNYQLMPVAERSMLASEIDTKMLRKVVRWLADLAAEGIRVPVAINLTARSLQRDALPFELAAMVELYGLSFDQLELDVSEAILRDEDETVTKNLAACSGLGIRLLLDDFGSGYSSLRNLHEMPISIIKIDQAFIRKLPDDKASMTIVQSTVELAHRLGKRVVAEGVETNAQWEALCGLGCDEVQGYFLMRPQNTLTMTRLLRQQFDSNVGNITLDIGSLETPGVLETGTLAPSAASIGIATKVNE